MSALSAWKPGDIFHKDTVSSIASTLYRLNGRRWKGNLALSMDNNARELSTL